MPRGGARANSGPPPDPNALRRDRAADKAGWLELPAEFVGPRPDWPFPKGSARERALWARLWRMPQAAAWVQMAVWPSTVGMYVRLMVMAEEGNLKAVSEARHIENALGLNPDAMLRKRWRVAADEVASKRTEKKPAPVKASARDRLKALDGGKA